MAASLALAALLTGSRAANAEIPLAQYHGWELRTDGRVNTFISLAEGDALPEEEPAIPGAGTVDNRDAAGQLHSTRIRDGFFTSILGFTGSKELGSDFKLTARVGLWMNVAAGRYENVPGLFDPRELYGKIEGRWGSFLAGSDSDLSRGGLLVDLQIAHEYGLGYPCAIRDASGSACGMVGFGATFPWYNPGFVYSTPSLAGVRLSFGAYDPATVDNAQLTRTPLPRFEGELRWDFKELVRAFASGFWQVVEGTVQQVDFATGMQTARDLHVDAWGGQAGGMVSLGPIQLGAAGFAGNGYSPLAAQSQISADGVGRLRNSRGAFGLGSVSIAPLRLKIAGGLGVWHVDKNPDEVGAVNAAGRPTNPQLIRENLGMTVGFYEAIDPVHIAIEYFRAQATWYSLGVPSANDPNVASAVVTPEQIVNFINAGMTVVW